MDGIKRKYVKWILLERRTPNYILIKETKMEVLRIEALKKAIKYEENMRRTKKKIVAECIKEIEIKIKREWEGKRANGKEEKKNNAKSKHEQRGTT